MTTPQYAWRKSTRSDGGNCVEFASAGASVFVRDSKDEDGPVLRFGSAQWRAFTNGVHADEFTPVTTSE
ncbi:DUF397 domain-containing protein [Micromonospora sp. WMMD1082]|uniref:DUF397 domain-containing protein n=1 Tax=Micromonospora sp. WMMD1082 TaxID=3016104 RepID=UPI00241794D4|nr:DUF397 domain-containing protein [Micromonospora sp. WMMD1082]MDG4795170.1 DUF397 domain-containing protein [Micromonospora sp. WMMD1082]